jgi:hypothetical protein
LRCLESAFIIFYLIAFTHLPHNYIIMDDDWLLEVDQIAGERMIAEKEIAKESESSY